ncbi:hypothetical protein [Tomitella gaofuii]|uniref:hypothetical protein n=1 Tax=Tomitella gaofuii TaxID=2760083 RepID=UPI0015FB6CEB|nr:hypothetical protein [Tomitella gaofuii]
MSDMGNRRRRGGTGTAISGTALSGGAAHRAVAAGATAFAMACGAALACAPAAAADPPAMTPLPGAGHELQVHGIATIDDVLHTDKDVILGGGDVRATTIDGVNYHYYRVVNGVRQAMVRSPELCLPQIPCHAVIFDDLSPVY